MGYAGWAGQVTGPLQRMLSYSLGAGTGEVVTQDVHLPGRSGRIVPKGGPLGPFAWVAQITLNRYVDMTRATAWISSVNGTDYFKNTVYGTGEAVVTFVLVGGYRTLEDTGGSFCEALANLFLFSGDSKVLSTPIPPQPEYSGGYDM